MDLRIDVIDIEPMRLRRKPPNIIGITTCQKIRRILGVVDLSLQIASTIASQSMGPMVFKDCFWIAIIKVRNSITKL